MRSNQRVTHKKWCDALMSRRLPTSHRPRIHQHSANPCQNPISHLFHPYNNQRPNSNAKDGRGAPLNPLRSHLVYDTTDFSEDSYSLPYKCTYQNSHTRDTGNTDCLFSDDSGSTQLPFYELDDAASVQTFSRHSPRRSRFSRDAPFLPATIARKVYPNQGISAHAYTQSTLGPQNLPFHAPFSRASDRPQSSLSSGLGSVIVDGCGGHCQTFENVCYYFLQVAFTMGVLIGTSLCIAGAVLRKSAAKNLQVLVYIGGLLSLVSALLLSIQCSARYSARKRRTAIRNAKRAPIPMETLQRRPLHQPLMGMGAADQQRYQVSVHAHVQQPQVLVEEQGVPWWRRKDLI